LQIVVLVLELNIPTALLSTVKDVDLNSMSGLNHTVPVSENRVQCV